VYNEDDGQLVYETIDFSKAQLLPYSKRAKKFVPLQMEIFVSEVKWKPAVKDYTDYSRLHEKLYVLWIVI